MDTASPSRWQPLIVFLALAVASLRPIRSFDYFWHAATGRWILEHRRLPGTDPFALASASIPWINGEWLFQILVYPLQALGGDAVISVARALLVAAIFAAGFRYATRFVHPSFAALITLVCWYAADDRMGARPSTVASLLLVLALVLLLERTSFNKKLVLYAILTVVWINVHPSALLAPVLAAVSEGARTIANRQERLASIREGALLTAVSALALFATPYGWAGVMAPVHLMSAVSAGTFVNVEWLPSSPLLFPLLYLTAGLAVFLFFASDRKANHLPRILLLALLAGLAIRSVRHQGLYFAAYPLLAVPLVPRASAERLRLGAWIAAAAVLLLGSAGRDFGLGADRSIFPVRAVSQLKAAALEGNIYNPDQFGGYLIWSFYPEKRVLQDGRNELYGDFLQEYEKARFDGRAWQQLLEKYEIDLAVDEYHRETIDVIDYVTRERRQLPISSIYFPRGQWALIGFDDVAMVFARRSAFPAEVLARWEIPLLIPDAAAIELTPGEAAEWLRVIERVRERTGPLARLQRLEMLAREELR